MSWCSVDGTTYTAIDAEQQRSWSLVIARGSEQFEARDLCDYWPQWRWDPGGLLIGWYHERPVWDPGIEISLHIRVMQELSLIHISEPTRPRFGSRMPSSA